MSAIPLTHNEYLKLRADNVRRHVQMADVLSYYGINVPSNPSKEFQYACPLHGDGNDTKPSARCYPDTNSTYCWACGISRDPIRWSREKEGLSFWGAVKKLEDNYNVPRLSGHYDILKEESSGDKLLFNLQKTLQANKAPQKVELTLDDFLIDVRDTLVLKSRDKSWPTEKRLKAWSVYWATMTELNSSEMEEERAKDILNKLKLKIL